MRTLPRNGLLALAAVGALALTSAEVAAQEQETEPQPCQAEVLATNVFAGNAASRVSIALSQPIGEVTGFEGAEGSGLTLAQPDDLPRVDMAAGEEQPEPIEMAAEDNRLLIWVNTGDTEPGTHPFKLIGAEGECTGELTVEPQG